ncbi:MAG: ABC transporter substrate-binding protein [bacterium]|nr:ABC transporter substrate-binding protein [bacterium]
MPNKNRRERASRLVVGVSKKKMPSLGQLRYINNLLSGKERIIIGLSFLFFFLSIIFIGSYRYLSTTEVQPKIGGEYIEAVVGHPQYINPVLSQTNDVDLDISKLLYSGLFIRTKVQRLEPDLVSDYEISEDQLTYTFYLRRDAYWHDGEALTANDVIFTIQSIQDPNYQSPLEPSLRGVEVVKVDDYTLTLTLKEPFAPFLSSLTFGILPEHIWFNAYKGSVQNITLSEYNVKPIGSGPFVFDKLVKDSAGVLKSYTVVPFEKYYGKHPYLESVTFVFTPDLISATELLRRKEVDAVAFISPDQKLELQKQHKQLQYYNLKLPQYTALFFNQEHSDILARDEVRQAIVWGVDRDSMIEQALQGDGEPIFTPILKGYIGHNDDIEKYGFDIAKGIEILEEGGWILEDGTEFRTRKDETLEFGIATVNQDEFLKTLEILKENWTKMGIKVTVDVYEPEDIHEQIIKPRKYEALLFGEIVGVDPDPYAFWHSTQMEHPGLALSIFYQKNIDDLLETARKESDEEERRLKYLHFQNILAEELPAIFLYNPYYTYAIHRDVQGVDPQYITTPADRFADISNWYRKTERVKNTDS